MESGSLFGLLGRGMKQQAFAFAGPSVFPAAPLKRFQKG
jgi:hypothetical protein